MSDFPDPRIQQHAAALHRRDARIFSELLGEVAQLVGLTALLPLLEKFNNRGPSAEVVLGQFGGPFPGRNVRLVPRDFGEEDAL